jgi:hypothetical protein
VARTKEEEMKNGIDQYEYETAEPGNVYRRWLSSLSNGREAVSSQMVYPINTANVTHRQVREDYKNLNRWGESYNNMCSMPLTYVKVMDDMTLSPMKLDEVLALETLALI